jgi:hypothetical protein
VVGGSLVIIAVMIAVIIQLERDLRRRIERRREAWKAAGNVDPYPGDDGDYGGSGFGWFRPPAAEALAADAPNRLVGCRGSSSERPTGGG